MTKAKNNSAISLDGKDAQLAKELIERPDGGMKLTQTGLARLLQIGENGLRGNFTRTGSHKKPSELAQSLIEQGFEPRTFSKEGIPDEAVPCVARYYANKGNIDALSLLTTFATLGARVAFRIAKGLSPVVSAPQQKPVLPAAREDRLMDALERAIDHTNHLSKTLEKLAPLAEERVRIHEATHGLNAPLAGLGSLIDDVAASASVNPLSLPDGRKHTAKELLIMMGHEACAGNRGFMIGFATRLAEDVRFSSGLKPESDSNTYIYGSEHMPVFHLAFESYHAEWKQKQADQRDRFFSTFNREAK